MWKMVLIIILLANKKMQMSLHYINIFYKHKWVMRCIFILSFLNINNKTSFLLCRCTLSWWIVIVEIIMFCAFYTCQYLRKALDQMGNLHTPDISHVPSLASCMFQIHVFIYQIKVFIYVIWSRPIVYITMRTFCCCYAIHVVNRTFAIFAVYVCTLLHDVWGTYTT